MRHIFAAVLGVLAAVASYQSNVVRSGGQYPGWQIDVAFAVAIWVGIVYLIAFIWSKIRSSKSKSIVSSPTNSTSDRTTTLPTVTAPKTRQQQTSTNPAMVGEARRGLPPSLVFGDATKYIERNSPRLSDTHRQAVQKAINDVNVSTVSSSVPLVWAFADSNKPFLVAHGGKLFQFGPTAMALWTKDSNQPLKCAIDRFGSISFQINGVLIQNIEPSSNAERMISILDIPRDDSILGENHELRLTVAENLEGLRDAFEEAMASRGIAFEWEGNEPVIQTIHQDVVKRLIEDILASPQPDKNSDQTTEDMSPIEYRIRQLQKLHDDGLITEDELAERRKEILREI